LGIWIADMQIQSEMKELELKKYPTDLDEDKMIKEKMLHEEFWRVVNCRESLSRQKSRVKWLLEEDKNSKFFYDNVNWVRRKGMLNGLNLEGWLGG